MVRPIGNRRRRRLRRRRFLNRPHVFRERINPFDIWNDDKIYGRFRFHRHQILWLVDQVKEKLDLPKRKGEYLYCFIMYIISDMVGHFLLINYTQVLNMILFRTAYILIRYIA